MALRLLHTIRENVKDTLDIGDRVGHSDYIDFINKNELTCPIMKGVDCYNRTFVTFTGIVHIRVYINDIKIRESKDIPFFETIFQRYTGNENLWISCGMYASKLLNTIGGATDEQLKMLSELLEKGEYETKSTHETNKMKFIHSFNSILNDEYYVDSIILTNIKIKYINNNYLY